MDSDRSTSLQKKKGRRGVGEGFALGRSDGLQAVSRWAWGRTAAAADRQALDVTLSCKKNQKEEGSARASPVATPMPKSDSF